MDYKSSHIKCMKFNIEGHYISLWSGCFDQLNVHVMHIHVKKTKNFTISES